MTTTSQSDARQLGSKGPDFRAYLPRFTGENRERNQKLIDTLGKLAVERSVRPSQLAIAWVLAKGKTIVPVIGARTRAQLEESLGSLQVSLTVDTRYDEHQMRILDSEQ